jgi:hemerythrin-like domain-containing protein
MSEMILELGAVHDTEDFNDLLDELVESIEDHLFEEEQELFPHLVPMLQEAQWLQLAQEMQSYREGERAA